MKKAWSMLRWFVLGGLVLALILMLTKPTRPAPAVTGEAQKQLSQQFEAKLEHLEDAKQTGNAGASEEFSADEVNAGLQDMTANAQKEMGPGAADDANVRVVGVNFLGDEAVGQFVVNRYGKDVYVTMSGHISAKDGYASIELTSAKIGNLTIPVSLINPRLQERLAEPSQRERLKLPDFVADLRVENGKLIFVEK